MKPLSAYSQFGLIKYDLGMSSATLNIIVVFYFTARPRATYMFQVLSPAVILKQKLVVPTTSFCPLFMDGFSVCILALTLELIVFLK